MLDIKLIKENPQEVIDRLAGKVKDAREEIAEILRLDGERRALILETDNLKAEQNKVSKEIPKMKKAGEDTAHVMARMRELSDKIKENDGKIREVESAYRDVMLSLPNLPDKDVVPGGKENNQELRRFGVPHTFDFEP